MAAATTCAKMLSQPRKILCKPHIIWQTYRFLRKPVPPRYMPRQYGIPKTVYEHLKELPEYNGNEPVARHPGEYLTMADVMEELKAKDSSVIGDVDISLPAAKYDERAWRKLERERRDFLRNLKNDTTLERAARLRTLKISLDEVREEWEKTIGLEQVTNIAKHYGIFRDLFGGAHYVPRVRLRLAYDFDDDLVTPVYRGNHITPSEAGSAPDVQYEAAPDTLWTLVLTNPDGHLQDNSAEYLHWFIGNIPGNNLAKGDLICDYLRPLPPKGTGFHRLVFVLYKQEKLMDYSSLKRQAPCFRLKDRTFRTFDFYKDRQDDLTPAGLAFFQSSYEESLKDFFHDVLQMREPIFEYEFPPHYIKPQKIIPHYEPFNVYLEKYRDPLDVEKEILLKRLKNVDPFKADPPPLKYPCAFPRSRDMPSWQVTELYRERMRLGKYRGLDVEIFKPERPVKFRARITPTPDDFFKKHQS